MGIINKIKMNIMRKRNKLSADGNAGLEYLIRKYINHEDSGWMESSEKLLLTFIEREKELEPGLMNLLYCIAPTEESANQITFNYCVYDMIASFLVFTKGEERDYLLDQIKNDESRQAVANLLHDYEN